MQQEKMQFTVRMNQDIGKRLAYIAEYYGRSMNGEIYWLAKQEIARFEKTVGKIELDEAQEE